MADHKTSLWKLILVLEHFPIQQHLLHLLKWKWQTFEWTYGRIWRMTMWKQRLFPLFQSLKWSLTHYGYINHQSPITGLLKFIKKLSPWTMGILKWSLFNTIIIVGRNTLNWLATYQGLYSDYFYIVLSTITHCMFLWK